MATICPYCSEEIEDSIYQDWTGDYSEHWDFECPECGNTMEIDVEKRPLFIPYKKDEGKRNPICESKHRFDTRSLQCPHYEACLTHAAKLHWKHWSCLKCDHRNLIKELDEPLVRYDYDPLEEFPKPPAKK